MRKDINKEISELCKKSSTRDTIFITPEMDEFIRNNYKTSTDRSTLWWRVCVEGNDIKYGQYMINPAQMVRRSPTFKEFYRGGIVD